MADRVVIMSRGRIEQIGTPVEIYGTPRNRFVAEFLGSANVFDGKVESIEGALMSVRSEIFRARVPVNPLRAFSIGDTVSFVVPEDRVRMLPSQDLARENCLPVRILGEEFVGANMRLYAEAGSQEIRLLTSHHASLGLTKQPDAVALTWDSNDAYVLPD